MKPFWSRSQLNRTTGSGGMDIYTALLPNSLAVRVFLRGNVTYEARSLREFSTCLGYEHCNICQRKTIILDFHCRPDDPLYQSLK